MAFVQGVGSASYKGECGDNERRALTLDIGSATSILDPVQRRYFLHLENMNLAELPAGVFDGLENLSELHLQGNKLRTLPEGLFRNLSGLRYLYLQNNGLEELPTSVWA